MKLKDLKDSTIDKLANKLKSSIEKAIDEQKLVSIAMIYADNSIDRDELVDKIQCKYYRVNDCIVVIKALEEEKGDN